MWKKLARFGYITKGLLYLIIGLLSLRLVLGINPQTTNSKGALKFIATQPFGNVALIIMVIGLICYSLWRLFKVINPYSYQLTKDNIAKRIGFFVSAVSYGGLAFSATKILLNLNVDYTDNTSDWTVLVMQQPFGRVIVAMTGFIVIGVGVAFFYRVSRQKLAYESYLVASQGKTNLSWVIPISKFGIAARGFIFILIGFFLIQAARYFAPEKAMGLSQIIDTIVSQPQGKFLICLIAMGFIAYSFHLFFTAKYLDFSELEKK